MTVISQERDTQALTLTYVAQFNADVDRVWQLWEDPRQLESWWGPPTWPATFHQYTFEVGGRAKYYMTGPEGEKARGYWVITEIDAPHHLEFDDGFANEDDEPDTATGPTHGVVTLESADGGTRMTVVNYFTSEKQLTEMLAMGMEDGMREALSQIDALLRESVRS
jgi:uncharacterized protein YndB with AHSA1/START domain